MMLISHRGNLVGPDPLRDNQVDAVEQVISKGFLCEVDVHYVDGYFWLGHDAPCSRVPLTFLQRPSIIAHAKDGQTLVALLQEKVHTFWHDKDPYTLTSNGYVWAFPGYEQAGMISVLPERSGFTKEDLAHKGCIGVCSDNIQEYFPNTG
jgi:hypothetical protein